MPIFLLTAYAKKEREDLSHADYNDLQQVARMPVNSYRIRRLKPSLQPHPLSPIASAEALKRLSPTRKALPIEAFAKFTSLCKST